MRSNQMMWLAVVGLLGAAPAGAPAQKVNVASGSVVKSVVELRPGEYVWEPDLAPNGPMLLIVNTKTQRGILYRNGIPIAATTVSTGRPGYRTPTGVFTILQKHVEHYSSKYDNAPMPYMQRLTWYGVALHAGNLPGHPASHGCIRLPKEFARLLYSVTRLGMTVVITDVAATPRVAPTPEIALGKGGDAPLRGAFEWHPEKSLKGPVSIIVSTSDRRAIVLRNGIEIGSGAVTVEGASQGTWAYARRVDASGKPQWFRAQLSASGEAGSPVQQGEWQKFHSSAELRAAIAGIIGPDTTIIVTSDSLQAGNPPEKRSIIEEEGEDR